MQASNPNRMDGVAALERLEAILRGDVPLKTEPPLEHLQPNPSGVSEEPKLPRVDSFTFDAKPSREAQRPLSPAPAPRRSARRMIGRAAAVVGLAVLGAAFAYGGRMDTIAASAATVTAAIGEHLKLL